jgi:hypothetical protein
MNPLYPLIAQRAGHRCEYCHAPEAIFNFPFEVEHIIPRIFQGADGESNLALACRGCNLWKSDFLTGHEEITGGEFPLFQSRLDRWEEHFQVDLETGAIQGLTSIGRATAARLHMNSPIHMEARCLWMRLGLFP